MFKFEVSAETLSELRDKIAEGFSDLDSINDDTHTTPVKIQEVVEEIKTRHVHFEGEAEPLLKSESEKRADRQKRAENSQLAQEIANRMAPKIAPVNVQTSPTSPANVDIQNMPWDERIHASSKTFNKDGTWRTRRGVPDEEIARVEAELKQKLSMGPMVIPAAPAPTVPVEMPVFAQPIVEPAPIAAAPVFQPKYEDVVVPTDVRPAHSLATFKSNFMNLIAQLINQKKIDQAYVQTLKNHFQVQEIWNILASEQQSAELYNAFAGYGFITKVEQ